MAAITLNENDTHVFLKQQNADHIYNTLARAKSEQKTNEISVAMYQQNIILHDVECMFGFVGAL